MKCRGMDTLPGIEKNCAVSRLDFHHGGIFLHKIKTTGHFKNLHYCFLYFSENIMDTSSHASPSTAPAAPSLAAATTTTATDASKTSNAPLYWMALGTFAVGAEGFMIAGILPTVATDLD